MIPTDVNRIADLPAARKVVNDLTDAMHAADEQLKADLAAKAAAKKQRTAIDDIEDRLIASTALAASSSGNPEQARAMLAKARAKAMDAAASGADIASLDAMVRNLERLAKIAEENRELKKKGENPSQAAVIPYLAAINGTTVVR